MQKFTLSLFAIFSLHLSAQNVSTIIETSGPQGGLTIFDTDLYVTSAFDGEIYRINWIEEDAEPEIIEVGDPWLQQGICTYGDYLCVAWNTQNKIVRINLSQEELVPEDLVSIDSPNGIASNGSDLFISSGASIYKVNVNSEPLTPIEILTDLEVNVFSGGTIGVKVYDNYLYIAESSGIYKVNLDSDNYEKEIVTEVTGVSFAKNDNIMYVVEQDFPGKIHKVDLSTQDSEILVELDGMDYPTLLDIAHVNNYLFVSCLEGLKVAKIDLNTLEIKDIFQNIITVHPNPAESILKISNELRNVRIYNVAGQLICNYEIVQNEIDISKFETGIYYLEADNYKTKFIKK